jgi:hypothetical protein
LSPLYSISDVKWFPNFVVKVHVKSRRRIRLHRVFPKPGTNE